MPLKVRKTNLSKGKITSIAYGRDTSQRGAIAQKCDLIVNVEFDRLRGDGDRCGANGRPISDIDDARSHSCCGDNGKILFCTDLNRELWPCMRKVKDFIRCAGGLSRELVIGVECRRGRHRSVAISNLLQHCLADELYEVDVDMPCTRACGCPMHCVKNKHIAMRYALYRSWAIKK